jgi:hypothetical protein
MKLLQKAKNGFWYNYTDIGLGIPYWNTYIFGKPLSTGVNRNNEKYYTFPQHTIFVKNIDGEEIISYISIYNKDLSWK